MQGQCFVLTSVLSSCDDSLWLVRGAARILDILREEGRFVSVPLSEPEPVDSAWKGLGSSRSGAGQSGPVLLS